MVSHQETIDAVVNNLVPKGNVLEMAKTAGLFAVKNTHLSIPDCHPIPIEFTSVEYEINELSIDIIFKVKTVYKTGVEVEAMHGASIVALTMYDMLKPIDKNIEISTIKLISKEGGKSSFKNRFPSAIKAAVFVCSDSIFAGDKQDRSGKIIVEKLEICGVETTHYEIIPDEIDVIQERTKAFAKENQLIIFTGGTGLSPRDVTPQALEPLLETRIPGIEEAIRKLRARSHAVFHAFQNRGRNFRKFVGAGFAGFNQWCQRIHGCHISSCAACFSYFKRQ